jgi:hypothetical protein
MANSGSLVALLRIEADVSEDCDKICEYPILVAVENISND